MLNNKKTFEECLPEIEKIVESRRGEWTFKASVMEDYDDIKSRIVTHIWKKWEKYDQSRPLGAWVSQIIKNQLINILRDTYMSTSPPCSQCAGNLGEGFCSFFGEQCAECPLYKAWSENKKEQHFARLPKSLEDHLDEVSCLQDRYVDLDVAALNLHKRMKLVLTKSEWLIYKGLFVDNKDEAVVAEELGFKTTNGSVGAKRLRQVKVLAIKKAKEILKEYGLEHSAVNELEIK